MQEAVAQLAELAAGSPAEVALQEASARAKLAAQAAIQALSDTPLDAAAQMDQARMTAAEADQLIRDAVAEHAGTNGHAAIDGVQAGAVTGHDVLVNGHGGPINGSFSALTAADMEGLEATTIGSIDHSSGPLQFPGAVVRVTDGEHVLSENSTATQMPVPGSSQTAANMQLSAADAELLDQLESDGPSYGLQVAVLNRQPEHGAGSSSSSTSSSRAGYSSSHTAADTLVDAILAPQGGGGGRHNGFRGADQDAGFSGLPGGVVRGVDAAPMPGTPEYHQRIDDGSRVHGAVDVVKASSSSTLEQQQQAIDSSKQQGQRAWWAPLLFWPPADKPDQVTASPADDSSTPAGTTGDKASSNAAAKPVVVSNAESAGVSQPPWWMPLTDNQLFKQLLKHESDKALTDKAAADSSQPGSSGVDGIQVAADSSSATETQQQASKVPWWTIFTNIQLPNIQLPKWGGDGDKPKGERGSNDPDAPVDTILIPADLPLEEIAKEVARLKEESWKSKEDHVESLWARTVERNDRSWLVLIAVLMSVAVGLLAVVAYRLNVLNEAPPVLYMAMVAAIVSYYGL